MERTERMDTRLLGRKLGTHTDWDGVAEDILQFYQFQPAGTIDLPDGDLAVNFTEGTFGGVDANGNLTWQKDIIDVLRYIPRESGLPTAASPPVNATPATGELNPDNTQTPREGLTTRAAPLTTAPSSPQKTAQEEELAKRQAEQRKNEEASNRSRR